MSISNSVWSDLWVNSDNIYVLHPHPCCQIPPMLDLLDFSASRKLTISSGSYTGKLHQALKHHDISTPPCLPSIIASYSPIVEFSSMVMVIPYDPDGSTMYDYTYLRVTGESGMDPRPTGTPTSYGRLPLPLHGGLERIHTQTLLSGIDLVNQTGGKNIRKSNNMVIYPHCISG